MNKITITCFLIFLPVLFYTGCRNGTHALRNDANEFITDELSGKIYWMGAYHKSTGIRVGSSYKKYNVGYVLDTNGETFYTIANIGDSIRKAAFSKVLYLYKPGKIQPIVLTLKEFK
jgi:hypothetical protein